MLESLDTLRRPERRCTLSTIDHSRVGDVAVAESGSYFQQQPTTHTRNEGDAAVQVSYDYSGTCAVVTGAARGVGRSLVQAFTAAGAHVIAADRDADGVAETCGLSGDHAT